MSSVNWDYLNIFKEPPLMAAAALRHRFARKPVPADEAELIVNTCLIGEFAASAPALGTYLAGCTHPVDLLVSPPLKPLAERMRSVRKVYVVRSVFARAGEQHEATQEFGAYRRVRVLRISPDAYRLLATLKTRELKTSLGQINRYGFHMAYCWVTRAQPLSWREVNFAIFGLPLAHVPFEKIFDTPAVSPGPAVLLHTGASWPGNAWPLERWVALLKKIYQPAQRFVFVGSGRDQKDFEHIAAQLPFAVESAIGTTDLLGLVQLMRASSAFVGVDSGPRNVAHLAGLRSITLLGPGPHMYTPESRQDIVLDHSRGRGLYQRFFAKKNNRLIDKITVDEVAGAFKKLQN